MTSYTSDIHILMGKSNKPKGFLTKLNSNINRVAVSIVRNSFLSGECYEVDGKDSFGTLDDMLSHYLMFSKNNRSEFIPVILIKKKDVEEVIDNKKILIDSVYCMCHKNYDDFFFLTREKLEDCKYILFVPKGRNSYLDRLLLEIGEKKIKDIIGVSKKEFKDSFFSKLESTFLQSKLKGIEKTRSIIVGRIAYDMQGSLPEKQTLSFIRSL